MTRIQLRFGLGAMIGLVALALPAVAPAASHEVRATGTVIAEVQYRDGDGMLQPLADVEVFMWAGVPRYGCTDDDGMVVFSDVATGVDLISATGVGVSTANCANADFLNPDTGKKMFNEFWNGHHGVRAFDPFQVGSGEESTITFEVQTPTNQKTVCGGVLTTIDGTNGADVIQGTSGDDVINGLGGKDVIDGGGGNDIICGGNGNDKLYGNGGDDWLFGESGKDRLFGDAGEDTLFGGPKTDRCRTGETLFSCER